MSAGASALPVTFIRPGARSMSFTLREVWQARELLSELAPNYRLASASNTNAMHWDRFIAEWALDAAFHYNFPSHRVGKLKPDREYFEHVLDTVGAAPERVLFLDDNIINVEGAVALGLNARRAIGVDGARGVCRSLGLLGT